MWRTQTRMIFTGDTVPNIAPLVVATAMVSIFGILFGAVVAMSRYSQTGGYVLITLCLVASVCYHMLLRTELSLSIVLISAVSAYQYFYNVKHVMLVWWSEIFVVLLVGVQYLLETGFCAAVLRSEGSCCYGVFTQLMSDTFILAHYSVAGSLNMGLYALIPFPDSGIYNMGVWWKIALFVSIWYVMLVTDCYKQAACKGYRLPRASFKCLPLLYMPPYFWVIPLLVSACNVGMVVKYKKNTENRRDEETN
jgi:hypothetical protein